LSPKRSRRSSTSPSRAVRTRPLEAKCADAASVNAEKSGAEIPESGDCSVCLAPEPHEHGVVIGCHHRFCRECTEEVLSTPPRLNGAAEDADALPNDQRPCPLCRAPFSRETVFSVEAFEPSDLELGIVRENEDLAVPDIPGVTGKGKGKMAIDVDEDSEPDAAESDNDYQPVKKKRAVISNEGEDDEKPVYRRTDRVSRKVRSLTIDKRIRLRPRAGYDQAGHRVG
jgi:hypothetical protein